MKARMKDSTLFWLSLGCFGLAALSFLLMAPWPGLEESKTRQLLAGLLFWLPLPVGGVLQGILSARRKKWLRYYRRRERQRRCGLLTLCANQAGMVADFALTFSIIGLGICLWLTRSLGIICYFFLSFSFFSLVTHCFFNGKNYNYIQHTKKSKMSRSVYSGRRRRVHDEEKNPD